MRLFFLLLFFPLGLYGQMLRQVDGVVVYNDHQIFRGPLEVCTDLNFISSLSENGRDVIPLHRVMRLHFYDEEENHNRRYCVLPGRNQRHPELYEIVVDGTVQVLRKKHLKTSGTDQRYHYSYFLSYHSQLYPLHQFRTTVYRVLLTRYGHSLRDYLRIHNLSPNDPADIILIVKYVNELENSLTYAKPVTAAYVENTPDFP